MKKIFNIVKLLLLLICLTTIPVLPGYSASSVIVYPTVLEMDFSSSNRRFYSKVVNVENPSSAPVRVRAYTQDWTLSDSGSVLFDKEETERSLSKYIKFNPREFNLEPGERQQVRMTVKSPKEFPDGEYRTMLFFETVASKGELTTPKKGFNIGVTFITRMGVAIYTYIGPITKEPVMNSLSYLGYVDNRPALLADLDNHGTIHTSLWGNVELYSADSDKPIFSQKLGKFAVLPDLPQKHKVFMDLPKNNIPSGNYTAIVKLYYKTPEGKEEVLVSETTFDYEAKYTETLKDSLKQDNTKQKPIDVLNPLDFETEIKLIK